MKKLVNKYLEFIPVAAILLTIFFGYGLVEAAKTWDNGGGDNRWHTATNWDPDGVPSATDTCYFDSTVSEAACTAAADIYAGKVWTKKGWTGNRIFAGYSMFLAYGIVDSSDAGRWDICNMKKVQLDSNGADILFSSSVSEPVGQNTAICTLTVAANKTVTYRDFRGYAFFGQWRYGANVKLTTGGSTVQVRGCKPTFVAVGGSKTTFASTVQQVFALNHTGQYINKTASDTFINNTGNMVYNIGGSNLVCSLSNVIHVGANAVTISNGSTGFTNSINVVENTVSGQVLTFTNNSTPGLVTKVKDCKGGALFFTSSGASGTHRVELYGSDTATTIGIDFNNTNKCSVFVGSATLYNAGRTTINAGVVIVPGTGTYVLNHASANYYRDLTTVKQKWYDVVIANTAMVTDSTGIQTTTGGDFLLNSGTYATVPGKNMVIGGDLSITGTFNCTGDTVAVSGDIVTAAVATITSSAATLWKIIKDGAVLAMNGLSWPKTQLMGSATIEDGGTFADFVMPSAGGDTARIEVAKKLTISAKPTLKGSGSTLNYLMSTTSGQRCTLDLPAKDTLKNFYTKDVVYKDTVLCKRSDTCYSGGGGF